MASTDEKIFNGKDLETYSTLVKLKIEDVEELLPLVIKVTQNNNVITCDTSVADIYTEYTKHRIVVCDYNILGSQLPLTICSPSFVAFLFQYSTSIGYLVGTTDNNADTWIFDTFDILTEIIDLNTIRSGAALGATAYQKPSTGIPKSDLEQSVQTSLGKADTALLQHQDLSSYADGAEYDSTNHLIYLKHGSTRLSNPIDATDFIKDGMVDTVTVTGGNLVITFNTDSGKLPITIPISDIFDANNYYTKTESDARYLTSEDISNKVDKVTSTDNAIVRFDGTTGNVQNSSATVDDNGSLITPGNVSVAGNIAVNKIYGDKRHVYNVCNIVHGSAQKKHFAVYTNIVFPLAHMVVITMKGFNYAYYDFESKLTFYMYQGEFYIPRVQNLGAYDPTVYLFSYNDNGTNRVAFGLESTNFYFFGCQIDVHFPSVLSDTGIPLPKTQWTFASDNITYTDDTPEEDRIIPTVGVNHCVKVTKNKLAVTTTGNVPLVTSTDNAITRFDGTTGSIQNSGVTIDDSNNIKTPNNISVKDVVIHGTNTSNDTRIITSDGANNIYVQIGTIVPFAVNTNTVKPGLSGAGIINLGATDRYWNNVYAKKYIVQNGTSAQFLKADGSVDSNSYLTASSSTITDILQRLTNIEQRLTTIETTLGIT